MKGFHNSFIRYCEWCDSQVSKGLKTMNWGKWWDAIGIKEQTE